MKIELVNAGKRYNSDWIFRHFNYQFLTPGFYAITGPNGSGKSTLLQVIATATVLSEGKVNHSSSNSNISDQQVFKHLSISAPYLELVEEMTLLEFLSFHQKLKPLLSGISVKDVIDKLSLHYAANKQIRNFSSGMKQRVKLAQAIFSQAELLLLDEPCSNLDQSGIDLYHNLLNTYCHQRIVIISSNDPVEYRNCNKVIDMNALSTVNYLLSSAGNQ